MSVKAMTLGVLVLLLAAPAGAHSARYHSTQAGSGGSTVGADRARDDFALGRRLAELLADDGCVVVGELAAANSDRSRPGTPAGNVTPRQWLFTGKCNQPNRLSVNLHGTDAELAPTGTAVLVGLWRPGRERPYLGTKDVPEAFVVTNADGIGRLRELVQVFTALVASKGESKDLTRLAQSSDLTQLGFVTSIVHRGRASFWRLDSHSLVGLTVELLTNPLIPGVGCGLAVQRLRSLVAGDDAVTSDDVHVLLTALVQLAGSTEPERIQIGLGNLVYLEEKGAIDIRRVVVGEVKNAVVQNYRKAVQEGRVVASERLEIQLGLRH